MNKGSGLICGILYLGLSIAAVAVFAESSFFQSMPYTYDIQVAFYVLFGFFILIAFVGILCKMYQLGEFCGSGPCLICILSLLIFGAVLAFGIIAAFIGTKIFQSGVFCKSSTGPINEWIQKVNLLVDIATQLFGKSPLCVIFTNLDLLTSQQQFQIQTNLKYTSPVQTNFTVTKVQQCEIFKNLIQVDQQIKHIMQVLEIVFHCSNWCPNQDEKPKYYIFNDINESGQPQENGCFQAVKKYVKNWVNKIAIIFISVGIELLLNIICLCAMFFKK